MTVASHLLAPAAAVVRRWSRGSQLRSRRNAMVATNALARRRAERTEVEELLAVRAVSGRVPAPGSAAAAAHG